MDFLYHIQNTVLPSDRGPLPFTALVIHSDVDLRGIYARQARRYFADVEACGSFSEAEDILNVIQPCVLMIDSSLLLAPHAPRAIRRLRIACGDLAAVTVGNPSEDSLALFTAAGIGAHINPQTDRVGAVAEAALRILNF